MQTTEINDDKFEDVAISEVRECTDGFEIKRGDGWSFFVPGKSVKPAIGDTARFYGDGIGYTVRGVAINGEVAFYRSEAEQQQKDQRELQQRYDDRQRKLDQTRAQRNSDWSKLPPEFQQRFARFNRNSPTWRRDHEEYERFCCEQAVLIAKAIDPGPGTREERGRTIAESMKRLSGAKWEDQLKIVPGLSGNHSGNTFDFSCRLAWLYLLYPDLVSQEHSSICMLVGCRDAGCVPVAATEYVGS